MKMEINKRQKLDEVDEKNLDLVSFGNQDVILHKNSKVSKLQSPTVALSGHEGAIYSISFNPSGTNLASSSIDGKIFLWEAFNSNLNYNVLTGHKNAALEVKWITDTSIVSCSADKTVALWDASKGVRVRKYAEHSGIVNCVSVSKKDPYLFASGSDDCQFILWDSRSKSSVSVIETDYPILSSCLSHDGSIAYFGGIDNNIYCWDLRIGEEENKLMMELTGHVDSITGLALSPDEHHLLSNAMDNHLFSWDIRPFVLDPTNRCEKEYHGVVHSNEKNLLRCSWSCDQEFIACGSSDRIVKIWNSTTTELLYYLPGHKGSVNDVVFHPTEPIVASCGTDKMIFLGELAIN